MKRIALTDGTARWFDLDKADEIEEETYWDGHNHISRATGSQWVHECLYRTAGGVWVLSRWSEYQDGGRNTEIIDNQTAAEWLSKQGLDPHEDCEQEFNELEIE